MGLVPPDKPPAVRENPAVSDVTGVSDALAPPSAADAGRVDPDELLRALDLAQTQIDDLGKQLEHAGRLALLGTLAATVAHEVNNLLTPAIGYAGLALKSLDDPRPDLDLVRKALVKARAGGEKAGRIGDAILGLARGPKSSTAAAPPACDVGEVVDQAVLALGREPAKDGIALRRDVPAGLRAAVDAVQLEHVVLNLLLNARAAMLAPGGRRGTLAILAESDAGSLRIDVADTGRGIPPERLPHVFEPFYSDAPTGGNGLGLNLCRRIVERHGGRIDVQSTVGRGSTFTLRLPAA